MLLHWRGNAAKQFGTHLLSEISLNILFRVPVECSRNVYLYSIVNSTVCPASIFFKMLKNSSAGFRMHLIVIPETGHD